MTIPPTNKNQICQTIVFLKGIQICDGLTLCLNLRNSFVLMRSKPTYINSIVLSRYYIKIEYGSSEQKEHQL